MNQMSLSNWRRPLIKFGMCSMLSAALLGPAIAVDLSEFRVQDMMPILTEFKVAANLTPNQQALWSQTEVRVKSILRIKEERRQDIQNSVKKRLQEKAPELRDLMLVMNQDEAMATKENAELRELWMTMYDSLSDVQRDIIVGLMKEQLARVADKPREDRAVGEKPAGGGHRGGKGGMGRSGGNSGNGGMNNGGMNN